MPNADLIPLIPVILILLGAIIGATFADIDLAPPLPLRHRSAWTHGPPIPLALWLALPQHHLIHWFAIGFLPAYALHLLGDCFPKRWHGGAKISLYPLGGWRMPAALSMLYLLAGIGSAGWLTLQLI